MQFELKPDYELTRKRFEAFWNHDILDRPLINLAFRKPGAVLPPERQYATQRERWLDFDGRIDRMVADMEATEYAYDSLPIAWPNLGPGIFSACCGCELEFSETTSWTNPIIQDWEADFDKARLNMDSFYFKALVTYTQKLLDRAQGRFIVGLTDFHPGGDHIAALRGTEALALDMLDNPEYVKAALSRAVPEYFAAYGVFYNMIHSAGMPTTSWLGAIADGTYYIPSNDFSCMVSKKMFDEFFLPGIAQECSFFERSIYHLDGPNALRHLDSILEIKELDAVQWVCGEGNFGYHRWAEVYKKIQRAGKSIFLMADAKELDEVFETLRPEGVWFAALSGVTDREHGEWIEKRIINWR